MPDKTAEAKTTETSKSTETKGLSFPARMGLLFEYRYAEWLQARLEIAAYYANRDYFDDQDTERYDAMDARMDNAMRAVMTTYAAESWMIWKKIEILEFALMGEAEGPWIDHRPIWMLGCIKADLMSHGINQLGHPLDAKTDNRGLRTDNLKVA